MENVITITNVKKWYGNKTVLNNVSLQVEKGEIYGLLGVNGAGKSTLIDCILGVQNSDSGKIVVLGERPGKNNKALFEKIGVQFQQTNYQDKIKVGELCRLTSSYYQHPADWMQLLTSFSLEEKNLTMYSHYQVVINFFSKMFFCYF